jgi:hypothetical protein
MAVVASVFYPAFARERVNRVFLKCLQELRVNLAWPRITRDQEAQPVTMPSPRTQSATPHPAGFRLASLINKFVTFVVVYYKYGRTSNNGHFRGIQVLSVIGGVR